MVAMTGHLLTIDGTEYDITPDNVKRLLDSSARFWLDLEGPDEESVETLLSDTFGFHPLAVEDAGNSASDPSSTPTMAFVSWWSTDRQCRGS